MAKFQYDDIYHENSIPLRFTEGTSTEASIDNETAFSWGEFFNETVLNFNEEHLSRAIGVDPFGKAEDGKYLLHLADDGTLKELVPDDRRDACLEDPDFCRQMIKLSQQGRLFVRAPGKNFCRQVKTTLDHNDTWKIHVTDPTEKLSFKQPVYPQAPAFWKYLLYPFFAGQIRKYNEERKAFENEYGAQIAGNKAYVENLQKSLQQLDSMEGFDEQVLSQEIEQRKAAQNAWEEKTRVIQQHNEMKDQNISQEQIEIYEVELGDLEQQKGLYKPVEALAFDSEDHLIQMASLNTHSGSDKYNYMYELKKMGAKNVSIKSITQKVRFAVATKCLENNLREINKYSAKDPEFRLLMAMNEAILEHFWNNDHPSYSGENKNVIDQLYNRQVELRVIMEACSQMVDHKMDALRDCAKYDRLNDSGRDKFRSDFGAAVLMELMEITENLNKVKGGTERNPLYQKIADEFCSGVCNHIVTSDTFWNLIKQSTAKEKMEILNNREKMQELAEKIVADPRFKEGMGDLHLDEMLKQAKSLGLYGPKNAVNEADAKKFEAYLNKMAAVDTTVDSLEMLKTEGATYDSYCEQIKQMLEQQVAAPMLEKVNQMDPQLKTAFLLYNKPIYEKLVSGIQKFVSQEIERETIEDYISSNFEEYESTVEEIEESIRDDRNGIVKGGLKRYMAKLAEYVPEAPKTTVQIEKEHQQIQSTFGGIIK